MRLLPVMEAARNSWDLENILGSNKYSRDIIYPDGCIMFRITVRN